MQEALVTFFVVADMIFMTLRFEPRAKAELYQRVSIGFDTNLARTDLVLDCTQKTRLLLGSLTTLVQDSDDLQAARLLVEGRRIAEARKSCCTSTREHGLERLVWDSRRGVVVRSGENQEVGTRQPVYIWLTGRTSVLARMCEKRPLASR